MIRGRKGTIQFSASQNRVEFKPERIFSEESDAETFQDAAPVADLARLEKNFFDCIRSGNTPLASIDLALRVHTVLCLAEMSERLNLALLFDEKTRTITTGDGRTVTPISYDTVIPVSG